MTTLSVPQTSSPSISSRLPRLLLVLLIVWSLLVTSFTIYAKCQALENWRYTSDMFVVDSMLQETLRGHFTLEYTYGRQFGDHALLILLALLPFKLLLGRHLVWLLILISPLSLLATGWILFYIIKKLCAPDRTREPSGSAAGLHPLTFPLLTGFLWFFSIGILQGPYELTFGLHIDTISGFAAVAMAAFLLLSDRARTRRSSIFAILATVIFCLIKEEMALLAIVFYILLLTRKRTRLHTVGLLTSIFIFSIELLVIHLCQSPWNRTNERLLAQTMYTFHRLGFSFLFTPDRRQYWFTVLTAASILPLLVALCRRTNIFILSLYAIGMLKLAFAWCAEDPDPFSWHNYSAITMITGSIILQSLELRRLIHARLIYVRAIAGTLLALFIAWFCAVEIPAMHFQSGVTSTMHKRIARYRPALRDIQKHINKSRVVSIPLNTDIEWTHGYRYAFYPTGITNRARGYIDYLVVPIKAKSNPNLAHAPFKPIYKNGLYRLYQRTGFLPGELESRQQWITLFGPDTIGDPHKPKAKKHHTSHHAPSSPGTPGEAHVRPPFPSPSASGQG